MRHTIAPKHVLNHWDMWTTNFNLNPRVGSGVTSRAMAIARHGMCQTWLDDGYVFIGFASETSNHYNRTPLFDYMGVINQSTTGLDQYGTQGGRDHLY